MPISFVSTNTQKVKVTLNPRTRATPSQPNGLPAEIQSGSLEVEVVQGNSTVELIPLEPKAFYAVSEDGPITPDTLDTIYSFSADADLGDGVETITDTATYTVIGENAANLGAVASPPEPK